MKYYKQVLTVTIWEYRRFFKLKNEILGIVIMSLVFAISYFGGKYVVSESSEKTPLTVPEGFDPQLAMMLSGTFDIESIPVNDLDKFLKQIGSEKRGLLLLQKGDDFVLHSWKKPGKLKKLQEILNENRKIQAMKKIELSSEKLEYILRPAVITEIYINESVALGRSILAYFFAGLMIMVIFLSFAYQFTAITGEKQLKITELIVSTIKPQAWIDGKILGITLTGLSSVMTYFIMGTLGGILYLQFTGASVMNILQFLHLPSILLFFAFTLMGILLWNSFLAAIASIITDPNNSGKGSIMLLPVLFVISSFLVVLRPDNRVSLFLSWFPLTSATAMPMRWVVTGVEWWQLLGSFLVLGMTFYFLRKLAAKIFHVSILISGKEPTWTEILRLAKNQ
jgi:ABC-2 type transport system permease protein